MCHPHTSSPILSISSRFFINPPKQCLNFTLCAFSIELDVQQIQVLSFGTFWIFFPPNIFNMWVIETVDAEPIDMGWG